LRLRSILEGSGEVEAAVEAEVDSGEDPARSRRPLRLRLILKRSDQVEAVSRSILRGFRGGQGCCRG
jgi:hypothetical protein